MPPLAAPALRPLSVLVVGGGPTGLLFSTSLKHFLGYSAQITVYDTRWKILSGNEVTWKTADDGTNRREQVVTLQSAVFSSLPLPVLSAIFPPNGYSCVWPTGGESPPGLGHPRNIRIMDIEDRLLQLARLFGIELKSGRVNTGEIEVEKWDVVVFADGPSSRHRQYFEEKFGKTDISPYSMNGTNIEDVILGLRVKSTMRDPDTVVLTIAQNRFLFNGINGDGYLYMRLSEEEAKEVRGKTRDGTIFTNCIQSQPCMMRFEPSSETLRCDRHETQFEPALNPGSLLWPRVKEGLKLFDASLTAVTSFRLSMVRAGGYVAELTETGVEKPVFGVLIGDAANSIHFWPGRGLNHGIYSAIALARCLNERWKGRNLRTADFTGYVATMSALQHRHKDRAWRAMVRQYEGKAMTVSNIIASAITSRTDNLEKGRLVDTVMQRVQTMAERLQSRLPMKPSVSAIKARVERCSLESLLVFAESGPWETRLSGGPEVNIDKLMPLNGTTVERLPPKMPQRYEMEILDEKETVVKLTSGSVNSFSKRDVLGEDSIRSSFRHALKFAGAESLAYLEAVREIRALFIRANKEMKLTDDEIEQILERADNDGDGIDRIDSDEFFIAIGAILKHLEPKTDKLPTIWGETFDNAATSGKMSASQAAGIVMRIARNSDKGPELQDMMKRDILLKEFENRSRHESRVVDRKLFLEVAAMVLFGY